MVRKNSNSFKKGVRVGASISPREAYRRGFRSGATRANTAWTKKAASQSEYYYKMGKRSR